nr:hypothetical protein [Modestobacter roseus]
MTLFASGTVEQPDGEDAERVLGGTLLVVARQLDGDGGQRRPGAVVLRHERGDPSRRGDAADSRPVDAPGRELLPSGVEAEPRRAGALGVSCGSGHSPALQMVSETVRF